MFRYDNEEVGVHWALPGGGLDPGETPREGAGRELREETGWADVEAGPLLCTWEHDYTRSGVPVRQHEHIFLGRGVRREPAEGVAAAHAEDGILGWRWWSPGALAEAREALWPPQLPELLADVERSGGCRGVDLGYVPNGTRGGVTAPPEDPCSFV